jgi:mannose-6-phosphate isomerase-like protein (cupin superfamily)
MLRMPGSILMTRLRVYDTPTPDGQRGGTPHVHLICTEMYFVLRGSGAVEMIDANGFARLELQPNAALLFTPGTVHRLINPNGDLEILVMMQNSGLPERGDNVVCFADEWMESDEKYAEAMRITTLEDAYRRRDRGVEGFLQLKSAFDEGEEAGRAALRRFYELVERRTAPLRGEWQQIVRSGAEAEASAAIQHLEALDLKDIGFLLNAQHELINAAEMSAPGFCGHLNRYFDPVTLTPEGIRQE